MNIETKVAISEIEHRVVLVVDGEVKETALQAGEILAPLENFNDFVKPRWNGNAWGESATIEEITAYKRIIQPTNLELLANTDAGMARVVEDLINILIIKGVIIDTDLPEITKDKIKQRQDLRAAQ